MSFKAKFLSHIESFFEGIGEAILSFTNNLAHSIAQNGGQVLVSAAVAAVQAAEHAGGDGKTKLASAVAAVVSTLETQGIPVVMNAVNGAIEAAVAGLPPKAVTQAQPAADTAVSGV